VEVDEKQMEEAIRMDGVGHPRLSRKETKDVEIRKIRLQEELECEGTFPKKTMLTSREGLKNAIVTVKVPM